MHHRPGLVTVNPKGLCTFLARKEFCRIKGCLKEETYCVEREVDKLSGPPGICGKGTDSHRF